MSVRARGSRRIQTFRKARDAAVWTRGRVRRIETKSRDYRVPFVPECGTTSELALAAWV